MKNQPDVLLYSLSFIGHINHEFKTLVAGSLQELLRQIPADFKKTTGYYNPSIYDNSQHNYVYRFEACILKTYRFPKPITDVDLNYVTTCCEEFDGYEISQEYYFQKSAVAVVSQVVEQAAYDERERRLLASIVQYG